MSTLLASSLFLAVFLRAAWCFESVNLLQHKIVLAAPETPETQLLRAAEPLYWVHFPKCGSSFMNTLAHMPGFCPPLSNMTLNWTSLGICMLMTWSQNCQNWCDADKLACDKIPHRPILNYSERRGHMVGFFRDPDQRILSGYYDETEPFASVLSQLTAPWMIGVADLIVATGYCNKDLRYLIVGLPKVPLLEFAEGWKGGMTYQLVTEDDHGIPTVTPNRTKVTPADGLEAARRVREGFAFVGITEEWDLSICLFHRMLGGPCLGSDFEDTRPSSPGKSAHSGYNTSVLMGWHDDIDEIVYEAALEVFHKNLVLYNVSHDTCQECYRNAGIGDFA